MSTALAARKFLQAYLGAAQDGDIRLLPKGETLRAFEALARADADSVWPPVAHPPSPADDGSLKPNDWPLESDAAAFFGYPPNLTQIECPYPMRMFTDHWQPISKITCNLKVAPSLRRIFAAILAAFDNDPAAIKAANADVYDGCLNDRKIAGSSHRSMHAYAAAIDLDAEHNSFNTGHGQIDPRVVAAFKAEGWRWGGDYHGRTDPMHFEACR